MSHDNPRSSPADVACGVPRLSCAHARTVPRDALRGAELARASPRACGAAAPFDWQPTRKWRALFAPPLASARLRRARLIVRAEVAVAHIKYASVRRGRARGKRAEQAPNHDRDVVPHRSA